MSDHDLRELERLAAQDPEAAVRLQRERCRRGDHPWTNRISMIEQRAGLCVGFKRVCFECGRVEHSRNGKRWV